MYSAHHHGDYKMSAQQNEKVDFSKFGKNFQEKLVHLMFRDRLF